MLTLPMISFGYKKSALNHLPIDVHKALKARVIAQFERVVPSKIRLKWLQEAFSAWVWALLNHANLQRATTAMQTGREIDLAALHAQMVTAMLALDQEPAAGRTESDARDLIEERLQSDGLKNQDLWTGPLLEADCCTHDRDCWHDSFCFALMRGREQCVLDVEFVRASKVSGHKLKYRARVPIEVHVTLQCSDTPRSKKRDVLMR